MNSVLLSKSLSISEGAPDGGLTTTWISNDEAAVTHLKDFSQLDALEDETFFSLETSFSGDGSNPALKLHINLWSGLDSWEEISNETKEDLPVVDDNLWPVEISQTSHEDEILTDVWFSSFESTSLSEYRLDCSETPIVVNLLGQETLGKIVEGHEFPG